MVQVAVTDPLIPQSEQGSIFTSVGNLGDKVFDRVKELTVISLVWPMQCVAFVAG